MIEEYIPPDHQIDNFYERFMEQRTRDLNNPRTTEEHDSFPFPIAPLRSISSTNKPKRSSMHSNDSGTTSPLASSRTLVLPPVIPTEASTPHPSFSQHAQTAQLSPREHLSPIQQFIRNSATRMARSGVKSRPKEPQLQSLTARLTRSSISIANSHPTGLNTLIPIFLLPQFYNFSLTCTIIFYSKYCSYFSPWMIQLTVFSPIQLLILYNFLQKDCKKSQKKLFCAIPKKEAVQ